MPMVRCFLATPIHQEAIVEGVKTLQKSLKSIPGRFTFQNPHQLHITLHFFGELTPAQIEKVKQIMEQWKDQPRFDIAIKEMKAFPNVHHPRVIILDITEGNEEYRELARRVRRDLRKRGFLVEKRKFKPHLTICRVKQVEDLEQIRGYLQEHKEVALGSQTINQIILYQSELKPTGPVYSPLHSIELA